MEVVITAADTQAIELRRSGKRSIGMSGQFLGYVRPDGRIGIRNYVLVRRAKNDTVAQKLLKAVEDIRTTNPIPENITGGLSTLEEKSLGAIVKSGTSQIEDVIQYAEQMPRVPASGA